MSGDPDPVVAWVRSLASDPEVQEADITLATPDGVGTYSLGLLLDTLADLLANRSIDVPRDAHPEDYCERCKRPNPVWNVDSDRYNTAVCRSEIVCPSCFVFAHEAAIGMRTVWQLSPMVPFRWIDNEGRPTPFTGRGD